MRTDEEYRHECEARMLAPMGDIRVTEYLKKVEKQRGLVEAQRLAKTIRELRRKGLPSTGTPESR